MRIGDVDVPIRCETSPYMNNRWLWIPIFLVCCAQAKTQVPNWVVYPDKEWKTLSPKEAGITDVQAWKSWVRATEKTARGASLHG